MMGKGGIYMAEQTNFVMESQSDKEIVKVTVEGKTDMPFWKHDLKLKAALTLIQTVGYKDFFEDGKEDLLEEYYDKLLNALNFAFGR
jgi:hypothetical protein